MEKKSDETEKNETPGKITPRKKPENVEESAVVEDQHKRGYYYDDAYGYQKYEPEKDSEDE